ARRIARPGRCRMPEPLAMLELLAVPEWNTPPRTLEDWSAALPEPSAIVREPDGSVWIEVASRRMRGYVLIEGGQVSAINFELHDRDPAPARALIESAALSL